MNTLDPTEIKNFLFDAEDFGYTVKEMPDHFKNNEELRQGLNVFWVSYLAEDSDYEERIAVVYSLVNAMNVIEMHKKKVRGCEPT